MKEKIKELEALMLEVYDPNDESQAMQLSAEVNRLKRELQLQQIEALETEALRNAAKQLGAVNPTPCLECKGMAVPDCNSCGGTGYC